MSELVTKAARFAARAHEGQLRKYTAAPYFVHCEAVARAAAALGADEATVAAAYLHDTLEDTATTYQELLTEFGAEVAGLVLELTDVYTPEKCPHLNRATRKQLERERLATVSAKAKLIKRADLADNTKTIGLYDPKFAAVYLKEKAALLEVL